VGATVTPEAAVVSPAGTVGYLGRIDDFYVSWGKSRRQVRERTLRVALDELLAGRAATTPRTKAVGCYLPEAGARR
jgi:hypothetical protein